jgi:predicted dehydrogenase
MGDVKRVQATAITALHEIPFEDTVVATLEFASGAIGTLEATTAAYPGYNRRVELTGSEGTVILEQDRIISEDLHTSRTSFVTSTENKNASASSPVVSDIGGHKRILQDFLQAIESKGTPRCDGREGRRSIRLVEAIYESSRTARSVSLSGT